MIQVVGLGNPYDKFKGTRHNIGREILIEWQKKSGAAPFELDKKLKSLVSKNKKALLLLPETMMNKSGNAIKPALRAFKVKPRDVIVLHDDADIELGRAKLSFGKHSAGHKGVESVMRALKTINFWRFRIGIAGKRDIPAEKLVLKKWGADEMRLVKKITQKTLEALNTAIAESPERAMNEYHK